MTIKNLRTFFLYCTIINYVLLLIWFAINRTPHLWIYHLASDGTAVSVGQFDSMMLNGMAFYKILILVFNLVPCVAMYLIKIPATPG